MPKKRRPGRPGISVRTETVPVDQAERMLGIACLRINPGGGRERTQLRWTVPTGPVEALWGVQALREGPTLQEIEDEAVLALRSEGFSWSDIGGLLRLTAEGARQRYRGLEPDSLEEAGS